MATALITGAAGFIGSHLVDRCLAEDMDVIGIDNLLTGRAANLAHIQSARFQWIEADINEPAAFQKEIKRCDFVIHLAGQADIVPSIEDPTAYFHNNVRGTLCLLEACRSANIKKFVYAASSSCYGIPDTYPTPETAAIQPQYPYALTKRMGEELVLHWHQVYDLPVLSLRLFNVYGPRARTSGTYGAVFGVFLAQKCNNQPYTVVGDGQQSRDFTFVTDVAEAFLQAALSPKTGLVLNVGSGDHYSINRLVSLLGGPVTYIPKRPGEPEITFADTRAISRELGWKPQVPFEDGVAIMLGHLTDWEQAPVWNPQKIAESTASWFRYLGEKT
ncbi:MAG: SDR family oxidoreductase [Acidobacteria bacterium]|nr:SDR family oxidoreductase [Acidobacteriota bacterium]MCB9396360.1 SDR family oxidoreductase [Acidobacteriota bacterium]